MSILNATTISSFLRASIYKGCPSRQQLFRNVGASFVVCLKCGVPAYSTGVTDKRKKKVHLYHADVDQDRKKRKLKIFISFGIYCFISGCCFMYIRYRRTWLDEYEQESEKMLLAKVRRIYRAQEVAQHPTWTTYNGGVYDFSKYEHPGGEEMMALAGGGSLEPFWDDQYKFHEDPEILKELETLRIGDLAKDDDSTARCKPVKDVPSINASNYKLALMTGEENVVRLFTLDEVKSYPKSSIASTIPCNSDSKKEETADAPIWSGTRFRDIIENSGIELNEYEKVQFECFDKDNYGVKYRINVPIDKVMNPNFDILLAYEMNNDVLPLEHGFPIRVVMPALPGRRSAKWLGRIIFQKKPEIDFKLFKKK